MIIKSKAKEVGQEIVGNIVNLLANYRCFLRGGPLVWCAPSKAIARDTTYV